MAAARQRNAYIWGKGQIEFANKEHYPRAMGCKDIQGEEYWLQSVLNSKSHARHLTNEIFQKKRRNRVTNKVDARTIVDGKNVDMANEVRTKERRNGVKYTRLSTPSKYSLPTPMTPDLGMKVREIVLEIAKECSETEIKVLAFLVVMEQLDQRLIDGPDEIELLGALGEAIQYIWDHKIKNINGLNRYIGSKYASDQARKSLAELVKKNFGYLTKII